MALPRLIDHYNLANTDFNPLPCLDHILTMQQSLLYYERVLSHSHPAYLSFLSVSLSQAKSGSDKAILWLSLVSIGTVCLQSVVGRRAALQIAMGCKAHVYLSQAFLA